MSDSDSFHLDDVRDRSSSIVPRTSRHTESRFVKRSQTLIKSKLETKIIQKQLGINDSMDSEESDLEDQKRTLKERAQTVTEQLEKKLTTQVTMANDSLKRSHIEQTIKQSQIKGSMNKEIEKHFLNTPEQNKKRFIQNFAIENVQPTVYVIDAKFCPMEPDCCMQILKSCNRFDSEIYNHHGDSHKLLNHEDYGKAGDNSLLKIRLVKKGAHNQLLQLEMLYFKDSRGIIEFSPRKISLSTNCSNGEYLALYFRDHKTVYVVKIDRPLRDIIEDLSGNETDHSKYHLVYQLHSDMIVRFVYDENNRFLVGVGLRKAVFFNLEDPSEEPVYFIINSALYDYIVDVILVSDDKERFTCMMACKSKNMNQVAVFDAKLFTNGGYFLYLSEAQTSNQQNFMKSSELCAGSQTVHKLNFNRDVHPGKFQVRINTTKCQMAIYNFPDLNLYSWSETNSIIKMTPIKKLTNMNIYFIKTSHLEDDQSAFYFVGSSEFDTSLRVFSSSSPEKEMTISKKIDPDTVTIYDVSIFKLVDENTNSKYQQEGLVSQMQLANLEYEEFNIDTFYFHYEQITKAKASADIKFKTDSFRISSFRVFSFNWPMICYTGFDTSSIMVQNISDDSNTIHRVIFPEEIMGKVQILKTFITDTLQLILLVDLEAQGIRDEITYQLYKVELGDLSLISWSKSPETLKLELLCSFSKQNTGNIRVRNLFARGKNEEMYDDLQVLFVMNGSIHVWKEQMEEPEEVCEVVECFDILSSNTIIFRAAENGREQIKFIEVSANDFNVGVFYEDKSSIIEIEAIKPDYINQHILCLQKVNESKVSYDRHLFLIFDFKTRTTLLTVQIEQLHIIGLIKSGLYQYVDGWIYSSNKSCKIRMDLVKQRGQSNILESELLDKYCDLLPLEPNETVKSSALQISMPYHRIAYITADKKMKNYRRLIVMPLPHERKLYLTKETPNSAFFYTTFDRQPEFTTDSSEVMILANNLNQHQCLVFNQKGVLVNKIDYPDLIEEHGIPVACSPNGLCFVFHKVVRKDGQKLKYRDLKTQILSVMKLELTGFKFVKKFNLMDAINSCYTKQTSKLKREFSSDVYTSINSPNHQQALKDSEDNFDYSEQHSWMMSSFKADFEFHINDNMDISVLVNQKQVTNPGSTKKSNFVKPECDQSGKCCFHVENIVYFQAGEKGMKRKSMLDAFKQQLKQKIDPPLKELLFYNTHEQNPSFKMNGKYFIFFTQCNVEYFDIHLQLEKKKEDQNFKEIRFHINDRELGYHKITDVRYGSNPDIIAIVINAKDNYQVMIWDLANNIEVDLYDVDKDFHISWSSSGEPIICTAAKTIYPMMKCSLNVYTHPNLSDIKKKILMNESIGCHGHQFDTKHHNWLVLREYLSLSCSYMTFVMKENIDNGTKKCHSLANFDPEPSNYIFNKRTVFMSSDLMKNEHNTLAFTLNCLKNYDPTMVELLHYTSTDTNEKGNTQIISPLHLALKSGNNRSVEIVLNYMSKITYNASSKFSALFSDLTNFKSFYVYLDKLPNQTVQLRNKQVLRVDQSHDDHIVKLAGSPSIYVDNEWYANKMGEEETAKSYPVDIKAVQIGWLINTREGKKFLRALYKTENLDIYNNSFIKIVIEYLYMKYKKPLIKFAIPSFVAQLFFVFVGIFLFECIHEQNDHFTEASKNQFQFRLQIISVLVCCLYTFNLAFNFAYRPFEFVKDLPLSVAGFALAYLWYTAEYSRYTREVTAFVLLFLVHKMIYYLKLIDELGPLLSIIQQIERDITSFVVLLVIILTMFSVGFMLIGLNQIEFDGIDRDKVPYSNLPGALWFLWNMILGEFNHDGFEEGSYEVQLKVLFVFCSLVCLVVLMNMLIAIMGDTFNRQSQVSSQLRIKDHLKFVCDHLFMGQYAISDPKKSNYLIAAFNSSITTEDEINQRLGGIDSSILAMRSMILDQFNEMEVRQSKKNKELKNMIQYIAEEQEEGERD